MYNLFCYYAVLSSVLFLVSWLYYFFCFYFLSTLLLNAGSFTLFLNYRTQNNRIIKGGRKKNNIYLFLSRIQTLFLNTGYRKKKKKKQFRCLFRNTFQKVNYIKAMLSPSSLYEHPLTINECQREARGNEVLQSIPHK